jgi:hypothetical protein
LTFSENVSLPLLAGARNATTAPETFVVVFHVAG